MSEFLMERSFDTDKMSLCFNEIIDELNLDVMYSETGLSVGKDVYITSECVINDGSVSESGYGKGLMLQGQLSGKWEALEHYLLHTCREQRKCSIKDIKALVDKKKLLPDRDLVRAIKKFNITGAFECIDFTNLKDGMIKYIPIDFINPFLSCEKLYAIPITNSGTSMGCTYKDALLHSINELIERQLESIFYLSVILPEKTNKKLIIANNAISEKSKFLVDMIEKRHNTKVTILYLGSYCNVYVFLAFGSADFCVMPQTGYGASLSPEYAVSRALTELLQAFDLYDDERKDDDIQILKKCESRPGMLKVFNLNLLGVDRISLERLPNDNMLNNSPEEQVQLITSNLLNDNKNIYVSTIWKSKVNSSCCVRVIIPEFEKLEMLRSGVLVIPSEYGRHVYKEACLK